MDRTESVVKNFKFTVAGELILALLKFASRRAFVVLLGKEYLGINGLFTDILSVLALAELGFGVSITYSLYRPAARGDEKLINALVRLYGRVYRIVALTVLAAGVSLTPFLDFFVRKMPENIPNIPLIYILNVVNVSVSYLFSYKSTLLFVYQKKYIDAMIRAFVTLLFTGAQIAVLFLTGNYLYYLYLAIGATAAQNIVISAKTDRLYPYLRQKEACALPQEIKQDIRRNVSAMFLNRMGAAVVFGTDNILISKFVGVVTAGLYSNYTMIRGFVNTMINALFGAITPALGNLNATESAKERQRAFRRLNFFAKWLFGWLSICLLWLYDPFIDLWLGSGYLLPGPVVVLIVVNFYVGSMRIPVANTRSVMGLFWDERYKSVLEALTNLAVSVFLAQKWGIFGVIAGTLISTMAFPFWIEPLGLYRYGLKQGAGEYFLGYLSHVLVTAAAGGLTGLLCRLTGEGPGGFVLKTALSLTIPNIIYTAVYCRKEEFHFLKETAVSVVHKLSGRRMP